MAFLKIFLSIFALFLTTFGLLITYNKYKISYLRKDDVLKWSSECIYVMHRLFLVSCSGKKFLTDEEIRKIRFETMIITSTLIDRGRLFFKNEIIDDYGKEKHAAYRGYRPRILDPLVIFHQVAEYWPSGQRDMSMKRCVILHDCLRDFVSLAQKEVGRDRAASSEALKGGNGVHLPTLLKAVQPHQIEKIKDRIRKYDF